jgi:hypothetical protein
MFAASERSPLFLGFVSLERPPPPLFPNWGTQPSGGLLAIATRPTSGQLTNEDEWEP